jgi:hypothetical protein
LFLLYLDESSGTVSGKDLFGHTPVGLFIGGKLDYFSVLYYGIGEISGKVKISVKLECSLFLLYLDESSGTVSGKVKIMVKFDYSLFLMDQKDFSGMVSGKVKDDGRSWNVYARYGFIGFLRRNSGKGSYSGWTFLRWKVGLFFLSYTIV